MASAAKTSKHATIRPPPPSASDDLHFPRPALLKAKDVRAAFGRAGEALVDDDGEDHPSPRGTRLDPYHIVDPFQAEQAAHQAKWQFLAQTLRQYKWWEPEHFENFYHTGASQLVASAVAESHPFVSEALDRARTGPAPDAALLARVRSLDRELAAGLIELGDAYEGRCCPDPGNPPPPRPWLHDGMGEVPPGDADGSHFGELCTFPGLEFCQHTPADGDAYVILTAADQRYFVRRWPGDDVVDYNTHMFMQPWAQAVARAASDAYRRAHSPSPPNDVPPARVLVPSSVPRKVLESPVAPAPRGSRSSGAQVVQSAPRVAVEMAPWQPEDQFLATRVTIMINEAVASLEAGGEKLGKNGLLGVKGNPRTADGVVVCPVHRLNPRIVDRSPLDICIQGSRDLGI